MFFYYLPLQTLNIFTIIYGVAYNYRPKENIQIRFLQKPKGYYGFRFANDLGELPKTGYLRPLMLVIMHTTN